MKLKPDLTIMYKYVMFRIIVTILDCHFKRASKFLFTISQLVSEVCLIPSMPFLVLAAAWSSLTCTKGFVAAELTEKYPVPYLQGECEWTRHRKQGIYFLRSPWESSGNGSAAVSYSVTFEPSSGDIKMDINIESQWCWAMWLVLVAFYLTFKHCLHFQLILYQCVSLF